MICPDCWYLPQCPTCWYLPQCPAATWQLRGPLPHNSCGGHSPHSTRQRGICHWEEGGSAWATSLQDGGGWWCLARSRHGRQSPPHSPCSPPTIGMWTLLVLCVCTHIPAVQCVQLRMSVRGVPSSMLGQQLGTSILVGGRVLQLPDERELLGCWSDGISYASYMCTVDPLSWKWKVPPGTDYSYTWCRL